MELGGERKIASTAEKDEPWVYQVSKEIQIAMLCETLWQTLLLQVPVTLLRSFPGLKRWLGHLQSRMKVPAE